LLKTQEISSYCKIFQKMLLHNIKKISDEREKLSFW
jgi:hypothetical protein